MKLPKDYLAFLKELAANNNREWFNANKQRFKEDVEAPFHALVNEIIAELSKKDPRLEDIDSKACVFRIYRDVRFSKNKDPYKTHMSALISAGGRKDKTTPGLYLHSSPEDVRLYSGAHMLDPKQLTAVRTAILNDPSGFKAAYSDTTFVETFGEIRGDKNKRLNAPFKEAAEQEPLLFNKSFYYFTKWPAKKVQEEGFVETLLTAFAAAKPVNDFLFQALS